MRTLIDTINSFNTELARLKSVNDLKIWENFTSMLGKGPRDGSNAMGGTGEGVGDGNRSGSSGQGRSDLFARQHKCRIEIHKKKQALQGSVSVMLPAASTSQMPLDITLLLIDAESITLFVSCMLVWVLGAFLDSFQHAFDLVTPKPTPKLPLPGAIDKEGWLDSIFRMKDKILNAKEGHRRHLSRDARMQQQQHARAAPLSEYASGV